MRLSHRLTLLSFALILIIAVSGCSSSKQSSSDSGSGLPGAGSGTTGSIIPSGSGSTAAIASIGITAPSSAPVETCVPVVFNALDANGNSLTLSSAVSFKLTGLTSATLYTDNLCSLAASSLTIPAQAANVTFYVLPSAAGTLSVSLTASFGTFPFTISILPDAVTQMQLTGPSVVAATTCAGPFTVTLQTTKGLATETGIARRITVGADQPRGGTGLTYSDNGCANVVDGLNFAVGDASHNFYFKESQGQGLSLVATAGPDVLADAVLPIIVTTTGAGLSLGLRQSDLYFNSFKGVTLERTLTLTNFGAVALPTGVSFSATNFTFKGGTYPGTGGTCTANVDVKAASQCTIVVDFFIANTGATAGAGVETVVSTFNIAFGTGTTIPYTGQAIGTAFPTPLLQISSAPNFNFPIMSLSGATTSTKTFSVTNPTKLPVGNITGSLSEQDVNFLGGAYPGTGGTCSTSLAAGKTCTIVLQYAPKTTSIPEAGYLELTYSTNGVTNSDYVGITAFTNP